MATDAKAGVSRPGRVALLLRTFALCVLLATFLTLPLMMKQKAAGGILYVIALLAAIPTLIAIQRGWRRYLWQSRLEAARSRAAREPSNPDLQADFGLLASMYGDAAEARAAFERARGVTPKHPTATVGMGHLLVQEEDLDGALAFFNEAAQAHPDLFSAHYAIGGVNQRREQYARAIASYERALALEPDDAFTLLELSRCWLRLGNVDKAAEYHDRAARMGASDPDLRREIDAA